MTFSKMIVPFLLVLISNTATASGNWSSEKIVSVTTYADDRAAIQITDYTNPNPSDAAWDCTGGHMFVGSVSGPAPKAMLSAVLSAHVTKKPIRFGVYGSGSECFINYISIKE